MKKKILLFFLVLLSTVLTVSGQTITVRNVYVGGILQPPGDPCYYWMTFSNVYANPGEEVLLDFSSVPPGYVVDDILITERNSGTLHQVSFIRNGNCYFIMINDEDGVYVDVNYEVAAPSTTVNAWPFIRNGQVQPNSGTAPAGSSFSVSANPDPGFGIMSVTAEVFSGSLNGNIPYMTLLQPDPYDPYRFDFIIGNHPVNVMATFMSLYYPPRLLKVEHHSDIISTDVVINGYQSVPDNVNLQYDEYYVYAGDNITATDNPNLNYWTTMIWTIATAPGSVYHTELYNTNIINFIMPDCDMEMGREVTYGPYRIKITRSAMTNGTVKTLGDFYYADAGYTVYLVVTPDPGYELVPGSLTVTGVTPQIIPTLTPNQLYYTFPMPSANVYVHARFRKATYNLTVQPTPAGNDFTARDMTLNPTNYAHSDGGPFVIPAQYNDRIRITATPDMTNYYSLHYYTVKRTSNNQVFGNVSPNHNLFTMSDFDLTLEPVFYSNPGTPPPIPNPLNPIFYSADHSYVMLHLLSKSKSSQDETPGWVQAIPGQPLCLTVTPNPGYQVKKDDITIKLVDVSQDAEIIVGTGDISGPDDYVTETTDYTFMYDLPADFDQYSVRLVIDVKSEPVVYDITVDPNILHGIVEVPATANADETVTLTVTPDPGYSLKGISVSPLAPGFFVDVENNQFTMPACNVFVSAQFQESEFDLGDVNGDGFISIADVTTLIDYLLSGDVSLINSDAADCHQDGYISIADVTALIDYLLSGSW